jgi:hypothetical protein
MLKKSKLPKSLWAEAVNNENYCFNRCLGATNKENSPFEIFFNQKPISLPFHEFGSVVYSHIPKELRQKLDDKAERLRFLGYDEESKGYRLFNEHTQKIIISRDVKFLNEKVSHSIDEKSSLHLNDETFPINLNKNIADSNSIPQNSDVDDSDYEDSDNTVMNESSIDNITVIPNNQHATRELPLRSTRNQNPIHDISMDDDVDYATKVTKFYEPKSYNQAMSCRMIMNYVSN